MRFIITLLAFLTFFTFSYGQQSDIAHFIPQPLELNPAFAGSFFDYKANGYISGYTVGRTAISPKRMKFSSDIALKKLNSGLGLNYSAKSMDELKFKKLGLSYSYHIDLNKLNLKIGIGIQYINDKTKIISSWLSPENYSNGQNVYLNRLAMSGGVLLHDQNGYISISYIDQYIYADSDDVKPFGRGGFNIVSGYHFLKGGKFSFCPSAYYYINPYNDMTMQLNLKAMIVNMVWVSATICTEGYYELGAGVDFKNMSIGFREIRPKSSDQYVSWSKLEIFAGLYFDRKE